MSMMKTSDTSYSANGNLLHSSIENSTILHFKASNVDLEASNFFTVDRNMSTAAVFVLTNSKAMITHSEFKGLHVEGPADDSVAVLNAANSEIQIQSSSFLWNSARYGSIATLRSNISVIDSHFEGNQASQGCALNIQDHSYLMLGNCSFYNNFATGLDNVDLKHRKPNIQKINDVDVDGGAIMGYNVTIIMQNCEFVGNQAVNGIGGAVEVTYGSSLEIHSSSFTNNTADQGAGIQVDGGSYLKLENTTFSDNVAADWGGAVMVAGNVTAIIISSMFTRNRAYQGGAISARYAIEISIENTTFSNNSGHTHNNERNRRKRKISKLNLPHSNVNGLGHSRRQSVMNTRTGEMKNPHFRTSNGNNMMGAALQGGYDVIIYINNSTFSMNKANFGAGMAFLENTSILIENSVFDHNTAWQRGGAIMVEDHVNFTMANTEVIQQYINSGVETPYKEL